MKTINRIQERNLSPELLEALKTGSQQSDITAALIDYVKKSDTIHINQISTDYTDYIVKLIQDLNLGTNITEENLSLELRGKLQTMQENIEQLEIAQNTDYLEEINSLRNTVNEQNATIQQLQETIDLINSQLADIQGKNISQDNDNVDIKGDVSSLRSDLDDLTNRVEACESRSDNFESRIANIEAGNFDININVGQLPSEVITQSKLNVNLTPLQNQINNIQRNYVKKGNYVKPGSLLYFENVSDYNVNSKDLFVSLSVCDNSTELAGLEAAQLNYILNLQDSKLYSLKGDGTYQSSDILSNTRYNNCFIYDTRTEQVRCAIWDRKLYRMSLTVINDSNVINKNANIVKTYTLNAYGQLSVSRLNNLEKSAPRILVKNQTSTDNEYIDADNVAVVHEANSFTVHNSSEDTLELLVIIPEDIQTVSSGTVDATDVNDIKAMFNSRIDTVNDSVTSNANNISALSGRVDDLDANVDTNVNSIADLNQSITRLNNKLDSNNDQVNSVARSLTSINGRVVDNSNRIDALEEQINAGGE